MTRVRLDRLAWSELRIPFRTAFRHASAARAETSSVWVEAESDGRVGYGESCPRPYVTGESLASARGFFDAHEASLRREVDDLESLRGWMGRNTRAIDDNPAAWCAIELAMLDLLARVSAITVDALLGCPPLARPFRYTAVVGDAGDEAYAATIRAYVEAGFTDFKLKLSGDEGRDRRKCDLLLAQAPPGLRVRVDANNLWQDSDAAIAHLGGLGCPLSGVEEPVGAGRYDALERIGVALGCRVILDESFVAARQFPAVERAPERWAINVRVSKVGGLMRSLEIVDGARARGIPVVVGAQVGETSVLTRAALTAAQTAGEALMAQEGAFGTRLLEHDPVEPCLMFGAGGVLVPQEYPSLAGPGFGLQRLR